MIVDESVSIAKWERFKTYAATKGIQLVDTVHVGELHPGMPDGQILRFLLNETTVLLTSDRPFHNAALKAKKASYFISDSSISGELLPGIIPTRGVSECRKNDRIQESYLPPSNSIRPLIMPSSSGKLKKLKTKRRRIRNHFGGLNNLEKIAVTVSCLPQGSAILIGAKIRISGYTGQKALDASENYWHTEIPTQDRDIAVFCQVLMLLHQLMLESVQTEIFWDALRINSVPSHVPALVSPFSNLFEELVAGCPRLEFVRTPKGPNIDRLRRKLVDLSGNPSTNEIVASRLVQISESFTA